MSQFILIDQKQGFLRVAQWQKGLLQNLLLKPTTNKNFSKGQLNDIYRAKIQKIIPKMKMAFVELTHGEKGFLNLKEETSLKQGDFVLVQIDRESIGDKVVRLRLKIRLIGHYLVLLGEDKTGIFYIPPIKRLPFLQSKATKTSRLDKKYSKKTRKRS